jgi:hydrogenase-4 component F
MPPFGLFASEFLILTATIKQKPLLAIPLLIGLAVAFAALFRRVQPMVAGEIPPWQKPLRAANIPVFLHLALAVLFGLYLPPFLSRWFEMAVELLR